MKLNRLEFMAMNNPVRAFVQDRYEMKYFRSVAANRDMRAVLEIGCGRGNGARLIRKYFNPETISAIDADERMIRIATRRNRDAAATFRVMDASMLEFEDGRFDAVFDFGIIHHVPDWKECLNELRRVMKPGGELFLEELSLHSFTKDIGRLWRVLSAHPYGSMFTPDEFTGYMRDIGFEIVNYRESNPLKMVRFFSLNAIAGSAAAR